MFFCLGEGKRSKKDKHEKTNVPVDHGNGFSQSGTSYRSWWGLATGFSKTHFRPSFSRSPRCAHLDRRLQGRRNLSRLRKVPLSVSAPLSAPPPHEIGPPVVWMAARSGLPVHFLAFWAGDFLKSLGT